MAIHELRIWACWPRGRAALQLTDMQSEVFSAYWRFVFAIWLTYVYFNIVSNIVNKKMDKNELFLPAIVWPALVCQACWTICLAL